MEDLASRSLSSGSLTDAVTRGGLPDQVTAIQSKMAMGEKSQFHYSPCVSAERLLHEGVNSRIVGAVSGLHRPAQGSIAQRGSASRQTTAGELALGRVLRLTRFAPLIPSTFLTFYIPDSH